RPIGFLHLGDLLEHVTLSVRLAGARGAPHFLDALLRRGLFLVRERSGRLAAGALRGPFGRGVLLSHDVFLPRRRSYQPHAPASQPKPSGSVNGPSSLLMAIRCDPVPSGGTPASLARARRL